jgi:hypothetical protein
MRSPFSGLWMPTENYPTIPLFPRLFALAYQSKIATDRMEELAVSDALEGRTKLTVNCEVVEKAEGFLVRFDRLFPNGEWRSDKDDFGSDSTSNE